MRTKTLLLTAALSAAGLLTATAQDGTVYSVNSVGYVNLEVESGFQLIANPLDADSNTVGALFSSVPNGTTLYKFDNASGTYSVNTFFLGNWGDPDQSMNPGEGAFILNPDANPITVTFVGEVPQGDLSHSIPAGFSIQASQVPQEGLLTTDLEFPADNGDTVYFFDPAVQNYDIFTFFLGAWQPSEPTLGVGESIFVNKGAASSWDRQFSVND